jgi:hypothetical protein
MMGQFFDLLKYVCPPNGNKYVLGGLGTENCQCTQESNGWILQRKNKHAEEFKVDNEYIYRGADTSEISRDGVNPTGRFYIQYTGSKYGAQWAKRFMRVGDSFHRDVRIVFYNYLGDVLHDYNDATDLVVRHHYSSFTNSAGMTIPDVLEMQWGGEEVYYYGRNFGLVGWKNLRTNQGSNLVTFSANIMTPFPHMHPAPLVPFPNLEVQPPMVIYPHPDTLGDPTPGIVSKTVSVSGANVRSEPTVQKMNVVGTIQQGDRVVYRPKTFLNEEYTWKYLDTFKGWVSNVATIVPSTPETDQRPTKILSVPYVSQIDSNSDNRNNDCGIAAALMLCKFQLQQKAYGDIPLLTVDNLIQYTPLASKDAPISLSAIGSLLHLLGVSHIYTNQLTPAELRRQIDIGKPVFVLLNYKHIHPTQSTDMGHFLVVIGYNDNGFWLHDPYKLGRSVYVTEFALTNAMTKLGNAASGTNMGFVLV